ncbi:hypothetical protein H632_c4584p0, partial [Helicosporidium sp. ATCC 50920]
ELCAEPLYQLASAWESYGTRAALETLAVLCKSALALLLLFYALCLCLGFGAWGGYQLLVARPFARGEEAEQGMGGAEEVGSSRDQAAQKLVLAEGSRAALAWSAPPREQGVYGLVGNLGSLA